MGTAAGIGHFVSWDGGCLFIGSGAGVVPVHAHYAIQIAFGSEPGIRFRRSGGEGWTSYAGAVVASRQPHSMDATDVSANAVLFVEPETHEGRIFAERYSREGIAAIPEGLLAEAGPALFAAWREERTVEAVTAAAQELIRTLTGGVGPLAVTDERVLRAIAYVKAHLDRPLTLEEVAAEVYLSPSRFRHLFVEQTGMAFRPYVLWRRFLRVWEILMEGATLTAAAHEAGFADAAHLSRTSRRMFGLPPSALRVVGSLRRG